MGNLIPPPELSLNFKPTFIPKSIGQFLEEMESIGSVSDKILKIGDFISSLETEMRKIDAFKRELPLCMLLLNDAIVALREELMVFKKSLNQPVLEEFMPLKKTCDEDPNVETDNGDKKNWLSSTQLWNTIENNSDTTKSVEQVIQKRTEEQHSGMIGDPYSVNSVEKSIPFKGYCEFSFVGTKRNENKKEIFVPEISLIPPCSLLDVESNIQIGNPQPQPHPQPPQHQTSRKQRRCWSTELHKRFVNALQQLGGSKVATPKQIRELMQVDGLTNDEVKSHLQKYRLHTKRLPSVALGSLWSPPHPHDHYVEKRINSHSGSPDGPLLNCTTATGGTSTTGGDSMDDGDDEKSENNCWKGHLHTSGKDSV